MELETRLRDTDKSFTDKSTSKRVFGVVAIAPAQIILLLVLVLPCIFAFWYSLNRITYGEETRYVGLENYITIFSDPVFRKALLNTIIYVNCIVYGELLLGFSMAIFFTGKVPFRRLIIAIVMAPYAVSTVVAVLMWQHLLFPDVGYVSYILQKLQLPQIQWTSKASHAFVVLVLLGIWLRTPFTFLILYNAIISVPQELLEASRIDGASALQRLMYITIPLIAPAIFIVLTFRYIFGLRTFDIIWIMTRGGPLRGTELLSIYLYREGFSFYRFGIAAAIGVIIIAVTFLVSAYYLRILYRRVFMNES